MCVRKQAVRLDPPSPTPPPYSTAKAGSMRYSYARTHTHILIRTSYAHTHTQLALLLSLYRHTRYSYLCTGIGTSSYTPYLRIRTSSYAPSHAHVRIRSATRMHLPSACYSYAPHTHVLIRTSRYSYPSTVRMLLIRPYADAHTGGAARPKQRLAALQADVCSRMLTYADVC